MDGAVMPDDAVAAVAAAAGLYLRVEADAVLTGCAVAALAIAEAFCGRAWLRREREAVIAAGGGWQRLPFAPVTSIAAVEALPAQGAATVLPMGAYLLDIDADGVGWVRTAGAAGRVRVTYTAGAGGWSDMPAAVAQGVALLAAHLFEHREGDALPPAAVAALWRPYRRVRL